jgi:hypothetical protein
MFLKPTFDHEYDIVIVLRMTKYLRDDADVEPRFAENETDAFGDDATLNTPIFLYILITTTHHVAKESQHVCRNSSHRIITTHQIPSFRSAAINTKAPIYHPATSTMSRTSTLPLD